MIQSELSRAQRWAILGGTAVTLSLAMGMRQSLGLFQSQLIGGLEITAAQFSLMNVRPSARVLAERAASTAMPLAQPLRQPAR